MSSESSDDLVQRMRKAIDEIEHIRNELSPPATDPQTGLAASQVPLDAVSQLKCCVDQFRLFLWAYIDGRGATQSANAGQQDSR